jgi:viologen exporter family transport system permease protein
VDSRAAVYGRIAGSRIRSRVQYRLSFVLQLIGSFFFSFVDFVMILVVFNHLPEVGGMAGWSFEEVAFLYGSSYVTFKLADILMTNLDRLPLLVRMGTFDQVLTRPLGTLGQVLTGDLDVRQLGGVAQGVVVLAFALGRVTIHWTAQRVVVFVLMLVSGMVIFASIWVITNAIAFWTMDAREVANAFTYGGNMFTQFPIHIFGVWMRRLLGYVIPLAFVNYFPSLYLLDKYDPTGAPTVLRFLSPLVAFVTAVVAGLVWRAAVRRYRSTGS